MDFDLFKPKAPPLFGLDISSSSVKMLEIVEAGRGAYRVERYAIEPLIRDTVVDGNISNLEQAVLIAATRKEKVEDRVAVAHLAGLKPLVMDVESFAQQAALSLVVQALPGGGRDQNIAVVDVGANVMNVTVLRNDQSVYTREQAFGGNQLTQEIVSRYGMSAEESEAAKRSGGLPDDFEAEVLRTFTEYLLQ